VKSSSSAIFNAYKSPPRWPFQPVIDGKYIQQSPTKSWDEELYNKGVSVITGFNTDEGSMFVPKDKQSNKEFRAFWQTILPGASSELLDTIEKLYPDPVSEQDSPYRGDSKLGEQFKRLSAAFGDYVYTSTVKETAQSMANGGSKVWKYHFDFASKRKWSRVFELFRIADLSGNEANEEAPMVEHASELAYFSKQRSDSIGKVMNDYYTSCKPEMKYFKVCSDRSFSHCLWGSER
jgi:carboxylesterase type B